MDGNKTLEGKFHNGLYVDHWTWWYPDGSVALEGDFALGNPKDLWIWITPNGDVQTKEFPSIKWVENQIKEWENFIIKNP